MKQLRLKQLYYNSAGLSTIKKLDFITPVRVGQNPFFENAVIAEGADSGSEWFGVWSWKAEQKIRAAGNKYFSMEQLPSKLKTDLSFDVIGFHHGAKNMMICTGKQKENLDYCLNALCELLQLEPFGKKKKARFPVMQNHFLARKDVFNVYAGYLDLAISIIKDNAIPKIWQPFRYSAAVSGVEYTFIPFVLENLFSVFLQNHKTIRCIYWKDLS